MGAFVTYCDPILISVMPISPPNPMFDDLLESSRQDDSDKWSNIGFGEELTQVESIEVQYAAYLELGLVQFHEWQVEQFVEKFPKVVAKAVSSLNTCRRHKLLTRNACHKSVFVIT